MSSNNRKFKKSTVKYLSLSPRQINDIVEKRNKLRANDDTLSSAIILDLNNKLPQSDKAKNHNIQYYRMAIWNEETETFMPFKVNKGVYRTGSRPKGEWGDKKKELLASNPGDKWEELSMEQRGPPQYFKTMFNCKQYDSETLEETITKEFEDDPVNKDLKPSEYNDKLKKYLYFIREEQEWIQCHLNIYDATSEIFSKDNSEWLYDNLNGYTIPEPFRSHIQTKSKADDEVMAKLKKSDPVKWKAVIADNGLIDLPDPVGWSRTRMDYENPTQLQTTFRDATNIGPTGQPRRAVSGSFSKPKVKKQLDYANFNYWLNPGSYCVGNVCEIRAMTSNKAPTTHCYWYDATVRTVASTKKEYQMADDDRELLAALGYGAVSTPAEGDGDDDEDKASDPDGEAPEGGGDGEDSLAGLLNMVTVDE
jgi:hypothetical protein